MSGENIKLNNKKIKISDFYKNKNKKIFNIDHIHVDKILVSKKVVCLKWYKYKDLIMYR